MNFETKLVFLKHTRIILPIIIISCLMSILFTFNYEDMIYIQIFAITTMISSVLLIGYTLNYLNGLIGLGQDRLVLSANESKFKVLIRSSLVLTLFILVNYLILSVPLIFNSDFILFDFIFAFLLKAVSIITGLFVFLLITFICKIFFSRYLIIKYLPWIVYIIITVICSLCSINYLNHLSNSDIEWVIGASIGSYYSVFYVGFLQILVAYDFVNIVLYVNILAAIISIICLWYLMKKCKVNYLELS